MCNVTALWGRKVVKRKRRTPEWSPRPAPRTSHLPLRLRVLVDIALPLHSHGWDTGAGASRALAGSTSRFTRTGLLRELGASVSRSRSRSRLTRAELLRDSDSRFPRVEPRDSRLDRPDIATTGPVARRRLRARRSALQAANQKRRCLQTLRLADRDKLRRKEVLRLL